MDELTTAIKDLQPYVKNAAKRWHYRLAYNGMEIDDMISVCNMGITEDYVKYDSDKGIPLLAYLKPRVTWRLLDYVRTKACNVGNFRGEVLHNVYPYDHTLEHGGSDDGELVGDATNRSWDFQNPFRDMESELFVPDETYHRRWIQYMLRKSIWQLKRRRRRICIQYFYLGCTLHDIGEGLDTTESNIHHILKKCKLKMKNYLEPYMDDVIGVSE